MAETYNDIVSRNANIQASQKGSGLVISVVLVFTGVIMMGMARHAGEGMDGTSMFMGASFITFGVLLYFSQRKAFGSLKKD